MIVPARARVEGICKARGAVYNGRMNVLLARTALGAAAADLALKLVPLGPERALVPGLLGLRFASNTGMSFSQLTANPLLALTVSALIVLLGAAWLRQVWLSNLEQFGAGLMLGGALGNLADRLVHGAVSDYLAFPFLSSLVFNLADACITIGTILLAIAILLPQGGDRHA